MYRLKHPWKGSVQTNSATLRDRFLRRGYTLENPEPAKPKPRKPRK